MSPIPHSQAVEQLEEAARDLAGGFISRAQWAERVALTMFQRYPDDPDLQRMHGGARVVPIPERRMSTPTGTQPPAAA